MSEKTDMDSGMDMSKKKDDIKMSSKMLMKMMAPADLLATVFVLPTA